MTWRTGNSLPSGPPRSTHRRPPLPRRSRALLRTRCHHHLHLLVPHQGGTGGPRRRLGTHRPLTRPKSSTLLHPSAEERSLIGGLGVELRGHHPAGLELSGGVGGIRG
jgi:hypothetical protein